MAISPKDIKRVKGLGFLRNRGTEKFSGRIITENGILNSAQMKHLSEAAEKFGNGKLCFTTRMTVELPGIAYENIEAFREFVGRAGMMVGGTGARVRPVVACKGTTCVFGLYDTQAFAKEMHDLFFVGYHNVALPHKFKIAVGGCPNNCAKPDLNDFGIVGQHIPHYLQEKCKQCKKCFIEVNCPVNAAVFEGGELLIDSNVCTNCGRCTAHCPFGAIKQNDILYKVYLGGRWGKQIRIGTSLSRLFTHDEVLSLLEKTLLLFKSEGIAGERLGVTLDRIGVKYAEELLLSGQLLEQKEEILCAE